MKRFSIDHISGPGKKIPFWMPWELAIWTGKSLLFLFLLLSFLALFCLPGHFQWLFWILLLLLLLFLLVARLPGRKEPKPHTGDVQVLLEWDTKDDLDLHVVDPAGERIYFGHKRSASGGELDVDANANSLNLRKHPKENVFWPRGGAPAGEYTVHVRLYCLRGKLPIPYKVMVKHGRETERFTGVLESDGATVFVCSFNM